MTDRTIAEQDSLEGLIARLRDADRGSVQRSLGSRIFGEAADALSQMRAALAEVRSMEVRGFPRSEIIDEIDAALTTPKIEKE